jgi:hypothetical protein
MRTVLAIALLAVSLAANAQIYRWVDAKGTVHYSNSSPPEGLKATIVDPEGKAGPNSPETADCYTVRCQGERLEQRLARREAEEARNAAERAANTPKRPRGLDFRVYVSIQRGMTEGELLVLAGEPDLLVDQGLAIAAPIATQSARRTSTAGRGALSLKTWTYLPTVADPFITTITLVGGRVSEIERVRKF